MKLDKFLAQNIVKRATQIIPYAVNVMDNHGIIIASSDINRLGQYHLGAVQALRQNQAIEINAQLEQQWHFEVRQGINIPITYLNENIGVIGISGQPELVREYAKLVKMAAELIVEQAAQLEKERWQSRYKEEFVLSVAKATLPIEQIEKQAIFFGLKYTQPYVAVVIKLIESTAEKLQLLLTYLSHHHPKVATAIMDLQKVLIFQPIEQNGVNKQTKFWQSYLPPEFSLNSCQIVIGNEVSSLAEVAYSYQNAQQTLQYAERMHLKKQILFFEEYRMPALLADFAQSWQAEMLFKPAYRLAEQDKKRVLLKTLQQYFFSNCDLDHAAKKLFIHPNTLRYRLDKIEQITALSFNKIEDKVILYLATLLIK